MKLNKIILPALLLSGAVNAAPPGKPTITYQSHEYKFAMVVVAENVTAYEQLITDVRDEIEVDVQWQVWSGDAATSAKVLLDGEVVWEGPGSATSAKILFDKGGKYKLQVELSNSDGSVLSDIKDVVIADTDGSHSSPLETSWTENNKYYDNKTGKIVGTYFVEWGIYERKYPLENVPLANLNRLIYGFIPICGASINDGLKTVPGSHESLLKACAGRDDFKVAIHDPWAALGTTQKGQVYSDPYKGNFGQLMRIKKAHPDLQILPSIGGYTLSDPFFFMGDASKRKIFVDSVKDFLKTWKFWDGVDLDFEFPGGGGANPNLGDREKDGEIYISIVRDLRAMLDELEEETGREYELTSAINIGEDKLEVVDYGEAIKYLDNIYMMSYDFYGAWDMNYLNHQTALHWSSANPEVGADSPKYYTSRGVEILASQGVPLDKLVMGVAAYGRGWKGVSNYVEGKPMTGRGAGPVKGTWEAGVLDYRDILNNHMGSGWEYFYDEAAEAPYVFNKGTGELVTYDDPRSVIAKAKYVMDKGLAGIFHWEMDADNGDLLNAMHEGLGHGSASGEAVNRKPIARPGSEKTVTGPHTVLLDGSASSDPEGDPLKFQWKQTAGPNLRIGDANQPVARVDVPEVAADTTYTFSLTVTDSKDASGSGTVSIVNKMMAHNKPPTLSVSAITYVNEGDDFTVTATGSDQDGDTLEYTWDVDSNFVMLGSGNTSSIKLKAPDVDTDTTYNFIVAVSDGEAETAQEGRIIVRNVIAEDGNNGGSTGGGSIEGGSDNGSSGGGSSGGGSTGEDDIIFDEFGCASTDANAGNYPAWDSGTVYTTETVSHNGLVYKAKYWVQGSEPTPSNEAYELVSEVDLPWNPAVAYNGSDQVNHNGSRWQAKWWAQGLEPGVDDVWINVGPAECK